MPDVYTWPETLPKGFWGLTAVSGAGRTWLALNGALVVRGLKPVSVLAGDASLRVLL